jgi:hypothetical protein
MRGQWKPKASQPRHCGHCSGPLVRRRNAAGRLEGYRDFMRRRFCSLSCANSRSKGGQSRKAYHYHARKLRGSACECCGTTSDLQAHHVNEDWTDNRPQNIQTLCIFCHHFWHAMHIRLGVKPTRPMPKLVFPSGTILGTASGVFGVTGTPSTPPQPSFGSKPAGRS